MKQCQKLRRRNPDWMPVEAWIYAGLGAAVLLTMLLATAWHMHRTAVRYAYERGRLAGVVEAAQVLAGEPRHD